MSKNYSVPGSYRNLIVVKYVVVTKPVTDMVYV